MMQTTKALAALLLCACAAPAAAMQIIDAADHAELEAEISATEVNRIALVHDRVARVIRTARGFAAEHDPASGDLYLSPLEGGLDGFDGLKPVTLFIGTEKGFTYRLALTPAVRGAAQILIRNAAAPAEPAVADAGEGYVTALVGLVAAVARRELLAGVRIEAGRVARGDAAPGPDALRIIETWRGPRFAAHVVETDGAGDAAALAGTIDGGVAAWVAGPGTGPGGGRLAVVVTERLRGAR